MPLTYNWAEDRSGEETDKLIGVTKLLCGTTTPGDPLRYGRDSSKMPSHLLQFSEDKRPVVVWNCTRKCNLHCVHCYSDSENRDYSGELTTEEARAFIDDLAEFKAPVLLFSGGEPFLRPDMIELGEYAANKGIRPVISTNGTMITREMAQRVKDAGFGYVGVSLDGVGANNDKFRGHKGAFEDALAGIQNCVAVGQKVGLRFTISRRNYEEVPAILDLVERENIDRVCFYHLVYSGRGSKLMEEDITREQTRELVNYIFDRTLDFVKRGLNKDILTVDNHADGVLLYLRLKQTDSERAEEVLQLLRWNGGNSSGVGIGNVDNLGYVHADQFLQNHSFGNVRERKFSDIWTNPTDPLLSGLKNRKPLLKGRCSKCRWLDICNGNFRARAEAVSGDFWESDPACYLTDEEIGLS